MAVGHALGVVQGERGGRGSADGRQPGAAAAAGAAPGGFGQQQLALFGRAGDRIDERRGACRPSGCQLVHAIAAGPARSGGGGVGIRTSGSLELAAAEPLASPPAPLPAKPWAPTPPMPAALDLLVPLPVLRAGGVGLGIAARAGCAAGAAGRSGSGAAGGRRPAAGGLSVGIGWRGRTGAGGCGRRRCPAELPAPAAPPGVRSIAGRPALPAPPAPPMARALFEMSVDGELDALAAPPAPPGGSRAAEARAVGASGSSRSGHGHVHGIPQPKRCDGLLADAGRRASITRRRGRPRRLNLRTSRAPRALVGPRRMRDGARGPFTRSSVTSTTQGAELGPLIRGSCAFKEAARYTFSSTWMAQAEPMPTTWVRPMRAPSTWRAPASPRRWVVIS